jgi:hypothetical protein
MSMAGIKKLAAILLGTALCYNHENWAASTSIALRAVSAIQMNNKLANSICLIKDEHDNTVCYYVNGASPQDAEVLLMNKPRPLSTEFTIITGVTREGTSCSYMLPSKIASKYLMELISLDLLNGGAVNIQIATQSSGQSSFLGTQSVFMNEPAAMPVPETVTVKRFLPKHIVAPR